MQPQLLRTEMVSPSTLYECELGSPSSLLLLVVLLLALVINL